MTKMLKPFVSRGGGGDTRNTKGDTNGSTYTWNTPVAHHSPKSRQVFRYLLHALKLRSWTSKRIWVTLWGHWHFNTLGQEPPNHMRSSGICYTYQSSVPGRVKEIGSLTWTLTPRHSPVRSTPKSRQVTRYSQHTQKSYITGHVLGKLSPIFAFEFYMGRAECFR